MGFCDAHSRWVIAILYAEGGAEGIIDEMSDWSSFLPFVAVFLALGSFYFSFSFLEGDFDGDLAGSFSLLFDLPDFCDLSSADPFFLLLESPAMPNS